MKKVRFLLIVAVLAVAAYGGTEAWQRVERKMAITEQERVVTPKAEAQPTEEKAKQIVREPLPVNEINWDVPFIPQAPFAVWDADHKDACEEVSALMVLQYFRGEDFDSLEQADEMLIDLVRKNEEVLGYGIDQTAQQVAELLALEEPNLRISVVADPTEASLKDALRAGFLAIVPMAGRQLGNPYFQTPGPPFHMLVLRGFTGDGYAITNDPGTKRGEEFVYTWDVFLNAIHDWTGSDDTIETGKKVVILVGPYVSNDGSL